MADSNGADSNGAGSNGAGSDRAEAGTRPRLHNALWPGLVGKGPDSEPPIGLDTMLELTAGARVGDARFDGVDLFLAAPHVAHDADDGEIERLAEKITDHGLVVGSCVAPVWAPTGGGSSMGSEAERDAFLDRVRDACRIARRLRELGVRPSGVIRIDSAASTEDWAADPAASSRRIVETFRRACDIAEEHGERLAAEGEICWGALHSWRHTLDTLEAVDRPDTLGFQADMAHTLLFTLGHNAPEHRLIAEEELDEAEKLDAALKSMTDALRPWTIDFHVAQNDATVKGMGSHDRTGKHCLPDDPNGKLDLARHAGYWLRGADGAPTRAFEHICWDGCMFPNATLEDPATWNAVLGAMVAVRDAHGWRAEAS